MTLRITHKLHTQEKAPVWCCWTRLWFPVPRLLSGSNCANFINFSGSSPNDPLHRLWSFPKFNCLVTPSMVNWQPSYKSTAPISLPPSSLAPPTVCGTWRQLWLGLASINVRISHVHYSSWNWPIWSHTQHFSYMYTLKMLKQIPQCSTVLLKDQSSSFFETNFVEGNFREGSSWPTHFINHKCVLKVNADRHHCVFQLPHWVYYSLRNGRSKKRGSKEKGWQWMILIHLMLMILQTTKCGVCFRKYKRHGSKSTAKREKMDVRKGLFINLLIIVKSCNGVDL